MHRRTVAAALLLAAASPVAAQGAFERLDAQAQHMMQYLRCTAQSFYAFQRGVITDTTAGTHVLCARIEGRMMATFVKSDSSWDRARSLVAIAPGDLSVIREPIDTVEVMTLLRAQRHADWLAWKDSLSGPRGLPVVYRADSVIHVWQVQLADDPRQSVHVGGERHYVFSRDARKVLSTDPVLPRRVVKRVDGEWLIRSTGDSIPTFPEILLANMLAEDRQPVTIELPGRFVKLATTGPGGLAGAWVWIPKKP